MFISVVDSKTFPSSSDDGIDNDGSSGVMDSALSSMDGWSGSVANSSLEGFLTSFLGLISAGVV